ncbi:AfsR/SARP family transcriptional regulator [Nakamurella sp. GG22]
MTGEPRTPLPRPSPAIRVLGSIELGGTDGGVTIGSGRSRQVLAILTVHANTVVSTDRLVELLWADDPPANPEPALHTVISRLRRLLAGAGLADRLQSRAPGYLLNLTPADTDAGAFIDLVDRAVRNRGGPLESDPGRSAADLDAALALWRGHPYAEFADLPFAAPEVARLEEYRSAAAEHRIELALSFGEVAAAVRLSEAEVARNPMRERPQGQLMLALHRAGRQPDALARFHEFRRVLDDELGLSPSAELARLHERILRHDPDLTRPDHTPSPTDGAPPRSAGNLPAPQPLIGRDAEIEQLGRLLTSDRLVVVTGPGGVGKTQLALTAAGPATAHFPDGAWLLELAALQDGSAITDLISTELRVSAVADRSAHDRLLDYLGTQRCLLVLDNCEHLVDNVADLVAAVLDRCPGVHVLATSQVPLNLPVESTFPLAPLPVAASRSSPAVQLFLQRARRGAPEPQAASDIPAIAELCRRLDGLPLAIELAAGCVRTMTPSELVARLPDRLHLLRNTNRLAADRHRTMRAVVEWSYDLLDPVEQEVFDRLSVFYGAFDTADAAAVSSRSEADALEALSSLVDRSMVRSARNHRGSTVFSLPETLRTFGVQRLMQRGVDDEAHAAHADRLLRLVESADGQLSGMNPGPWVREVADRFDDLRIAHSWALEHDLPLALRLVTGLVDWLELTMVSELVGWAEATALRSITAGLDGPEASGRTVIALSMAAAGGRFGGDFPQAERLAEQALGLAPATDDPVRRFPIYTLAEINLYRGRLAEARGQAERVRRLSGSVDLLRAGWCRMHQALADAYRGDVEAALAVGEQLLAERPKPAVTHAWAQYTLGEVLLALDPLRAAVLLEAAIAAARRHGDRFLTGVALVSAASVRVRGADPLPAVPMLREVVEHWHRQADWTHQWTTFRVVAELLVRLGRDEPAAVVLGAQRWGHRAGTVFGQDAERLDVLAGTLTDRLGAERLRELMLRGGQLSDAELLDTVRDALTAAAGPQQSAGSSR